MSHVADVELHIKDLTALEAAVKALGGEFRKGQKTHQWYGRFLNDWHSDRAAVNRRDPKLFGTCDHAIRFPGISYEIGLVKDPDGTYTCIYDVYGVGRQLEQKCGGVGLPKLKDEYAAAVTTRTLTRKGFRCRRATNSAGEIVIHAVR